ncbi:MAG: T9SS type A sorting domain-containing protein [Bacteroidetes bacterium]|nr:T9SS type A sorting domain-containing protein [Bacteroidota bacterium]
MNKVKHHLVILFIIPIISISFDLYSQNIVFNKNKIIFKYDSLSSRLADTVIIYNTGDNELKIDSIYSLNYYGYRLNIFLHDTSFNYYVFGGQDSINISISSNDSAKFIFSDPSICPICKRLMKIAAFKDTIIFHSNSKNSNYTFLYVEALGYVHIDDEQSIIEEYLLYQNYPNPFNPSTTISYQLPHAGFVTLKVLDVLGREVKTLVNEYKGIGNYFVSFDASDLPSGIYIYQLNANGFFSTKKMLLIK